MDAISAAGAATGGDGGTGENASELVSRALREVSSVSAYEERIAQMEQMLTDIDNLLSDFNHEISSYLSGEEFDDESFYPDRKEGLSEINHLKSKVWKYDGRDSAVSGRKNKAYCRITGL